MSTTSPKTNAAHDAGAEESIADLVGLIRDEYDEMPGLVLTCPQFCRMFGFGPPTCEAIMHRLVKEGFLIRVPSGSYAKRRALM
jgi:hypothetical protein